MGLAQGSSHVIGRIPNALWEPFQHGNVAHLPHAASAQRISDGSNHVPLAGLLAHVHAIHLLYLVWLSQGGGVLAVLLQGILNFSVPLILRAVVILGRAAVGKQYLHDPCRDRAYNHWKHHNEQHGSNHSFSDLKERGLHERYHGLMDTCRLWMFGGRQIRKWVALHNRLFAFGMHGRGRTT